MTFLNIQDKISRYSLFTEKLNSSCNFHKIRVNLRVYDWVFCIQSYMVLINGHLKYDDDEYPLCIGISHAWHAPVVAPGTSGMVTRKINTKEGTIMTYSSVKMNE